jgi:hypothetical protein
MILPVPASATATMSFPFPLNLSGLTPFHVIYRDEITKAQLEIMARVFITLQGGHGWSKTDCLIEKGSVENKGMKLPVFSAGIDFRRQALQKIRIV